MSGCLADIIVYYKFLMSVLLLFVPFMIAKQD